MIGRNACSSRPSERLAMLIARRYGQELHRWLAHRLRGTEQAPDLQQEIYLRLLRTRDEDLVRNPQAYMYRIATHVLYEFKQRAQRELVTFDSQKVDELGEQSADWPSDGLAEQLATAQQLQKGLTALPPAWRTAFLLHMQYGLSHQEVAAQLRISVHTVKKYMLKAFVTLRSEMGARA